MLTSQVTGRVREWVESTYPLEGCGLVLRAPDGELRVHPCQNIADRLHEHDPHAHPRTRRTSYAIDPIEILAAEQRGESLVAIFHSHCDAADAFSDEDERAATVHLADGPAPLHPGVVHVVVSVLGGRAVGGTCYAFEAASGRYLPVGPLDELDTASG